MTVLDEVAGGGGGADGVVAHDGIRLNSDRLAVHEHESGAALLLREQIGLVLACGGEDESVDTPSQERRDDRQLPLRVVVEARREHGDAPGGAASRSRDAPLPANGLPTFPTRRPMVFVLRSLRAQVSRVQDRAGSAGSGPRPGL